MYGQVARPPKLTGSVALLSADATNLWTQDSTHVLHNNDTMSESEQHTEALITAKSAVGYHYRSFQGWDNPSFKERLSANELLPPTKLIKVERDAAVTGSYDQQTRNYESFDFSSHVKTSHNDVDADIRSNGPWLYNNFLVDHEDHIVDFEESEELFRSLSTNGVVQKAAAKIYTSGFDALTSGAEFHKTLRLFKGLRKRILKEISKGRLYNLWLEGRYGWRILIYELIELDQAISHWSETRTRYTDYAFERENSSTKFLDPRTTTAFAPSASIPSIFPRNYHPTYHLSYDQERKISLKGQVTADVSPSRFRFNVFDTAWEIIPYSFVIDWFVNIGSWIQSISFDHYATDLVASGSIQVSTTRKYYTVLHGATQATIITSGSGFDVHGDSSQILTERNPTTLSKLPQFAPNLDAFKVLDLIALMKGAQIRR